MPKITAHLIKLCLCIAMCACSDAGVTKRGTYSATAETERVCVITGVMKEKPCYFLLEELADSKPEKPLAIKTYGYLGKRDDLFFLSSDRSGQENFTRIDVKVGRWSDAEASIFLGKRVEVIGFFRAASEGGGVETGEIEVLALGWIRE